MDEYKHYIRLNGDIIVYGFTSAFETPQAGDILIAGDGRHFTTPLANERQQFIYRYANGTITLRSQAELDAEWEARPPEPKTPEQIENEQLNLSIIEIWESIIPLLPE